MTEVRNDARTDEPNSAIVDAAGIEKRYDSWLPFSRAVEVLDGATLRIGSGEVVGIMGENGSGKSTLMEILAGVLDADGGTVDRTGTVGWCPQEPRLYDRLTVDETFELFGEAYGMSDADVEAAEAWVLDELDFERFRDRQVRNLSGGNRQKLNLGVALMHDPDLLLLDEPYTGFDWETFQAFWDLTEELRDRGVGVAIISHILNERDRFDVIYELHDGHLHREVVDEADEAAGPESSPSEASLDCDRPREGGDTV